MKARLYDLDLRYIFEGNAVYKKDEEAVYLKADEDLQAKGPDFLVHYTDDQQGVFDFRCVYKGFEQEGSQFFIELGIVETLKTLQRRMDVKVKTNIPVKIILLNDDDQIKLDPETHRTVQHQAMLRDISAGGIMIDSEADLEVGQKIMFPFDKGSSPILVNALVIREQPPSQGYRCYGCRFLNNNSGKESVIREYVFRLQLAGKNKARSSGDL